MFATSDWLAIISWLHLLNQFSVYWLINYLFYIWIFIIYFELLKKSIIIWFVLRKLLDRRNCNANLSHQYDLELIIIRLLACSNIHDLDIC